MSERERKIDWLDSNIPHEMRSVISAMYRDNRQPTGRIYRRIVCKLPVGGHLFLFNLINYTFKARIAAENVLSLIVCACAFHVDNHQHHDYHHNRTPPPAHHSRLSTTKRRRQTPLPTPTHCMLLDSNSAHSALVRVWAPGPVLMNIVCVFRHHPKPPFAPRSLSHSLSLSFCPVLIRSPLSRVCPHNKTTNDPTTQPNPVRCTGAFVPYTRV